MYILKHEDIFTVVNSKGYFKIAEKYIVDYNGQSYAKNSLARNSSRINKDKEKFKDVIKSVDELIKACCE